MEDRIAALEARVAALEAKLAVTPPGPSRAEQQRTILIAWFRHATRTYTAEEVAVELEGTDFSRTEILARLEELCAEKKLIRSSISWPDGTKQYYTRAPDLDLGL